MSSFHCLTFCFLFQQPQMSDFLSHSIARFWTVLCFWCYSDLEWTFPSSPLQKKKTKKKHTWNLQIFLFTAPTQRFNCWHTGSSPYHLLSERCQKPEVLFCPVHEEGSNLLKSHAWLSLTQSWTPRKATDCTTNCIILHHHLRAFQHTRHPRGSTSPSALVCFLQRASCLWVCIQRQIKKTKTKRNTVISLADEGRAVDTVYVDFSGAQKLTS